MGQCCVIEYIIGRRKEASERVVGCTMEYRLGWNTISKVSRSLWQVIDCPRTNPLYSTCLTNGRPTVFYRRTHLQTGHCIASLGGHWPPITLLPPRPAHNNTAEESHNNTVDEIHNNTRLLFARSHHLLSAISFKADFKLYTGAIVLSLSCVAFQLHIWFCFISSHRLHPVCPTYSILLSLGPKCPIWRRPVLKCTLGSMLLSCNTGQNCDLVWFTKINGTKCIAF